jgi:hypothetical protein
MNGCDHKFIDSSHCLKCGWTPPGSFKVVDKRGQPKPERKPLGDPGYLLKLRRTGNPREFLAVFPYNRKPEHYFNVNKIEDEGMELGKNPPAQMTRRQKKAIERAGRRMQQVIEEARRFHYSTAQLQASAPTPPASEVAEPEEIQ